ncbi:MAG: DinB family protein [Thermomicrobiales bacterium]
MNAQDAYISQIRTMTDEINAMFEDVPEDILYKRPGPSLNPVGWNYWHLLRIWDMWLNVQIHGRDVSEDTWHRGGFSEKSGYNPDGKGGRGGGTGMGYTDAEVDEVQIPLEIIQEYQRQLQAETEEYLRGADEDELNRSVPYWAGEITCAKMIEQSIRNGWMHYGEMRYAKGMLGRPDASYPGQ